MYVPFFDDESALIVSNIICDLLTIHSNLLDFFGKR